MNDEQRRKDMKIAILLYDRFTTLDAVGPYECSAGCGRGGGVHGRGGRPVRGDQGSLALVADAAFWRSDRADPAAVPGGPVRRRPDGPKVLDWVREWTRGAPGPPRSCSGSLILPRRLLTRRAGDTHWAGHEVLARFGAVPPRSGWSSTAVREPPPGFGRDRPRHFTWPG
ncbi:hypothetical protein GCM10020229_12530 [Kitasatospora albolonga]